VVLAAGKKGQARRASGAGKKKARKATKKRTPAKRRPAKGKRAQPTQPNGPEKESDAEKLRKQMLRSVEEIRRVEERLSKLREREQELRAIEAKRRHRRELSARADKHWGEMGEEERRRYLEIVRHAFEKEGYRSTMFQWRHRGHAYGLIKDLGDKQIHVRVYDNGIIDAEMEIHKRYLQHLYSPRPSAHKEVVEVLRKHGVLSHLVNEHYLPQVGADRKDFPKRRTKISALLGSAAAVGGMVAVSVARIALDRRKRKPS
jgi:hypothetical protein